MKDAQPVGTSPEVLQHYLTAGIPIRHARFNLERVLGLGCLHAEGLLFESMWKWEYADCLPVLRPFSQLCTPLEDGTVPAVEALRLALGWPASFYRERFTARLYNSAPGDWCVRIESYSDYSGGWIRLGGDYGAWVFDSFDSPQYSKVVNPLAAYDYLRSLHFAVGLEPHQYIEKTPAAAPIIQEGTSQPK